MEQGYHGATRRPAGLGRGRVGGRRAGFSLIELMMATVVLVVAITSALASHVISWNLLKCSRETNVAVSDAQTVMEQMLLMSIDDLPLAGSPYIGGAPIVAFNGLHLRNEVVTATYPTYVVGAPIPDPLEMRVTVNWNDFGGRPRTITLASLKTK